MQHEINSHLEKMQLATDPTVYLRLICLLFKYYLGPKLHLVVVLMMILNDKVD